MDSAQLYRMLVFATVVEQGSLTAAAVELDISRSMVSQHLKKLETRLNCKLLNRTTRKIALTQEGQAFFRYCAELLLLAKQAQQAIAPQDKELRGSLKLCAPVGIGEQMLLPLIGKFHQAYPKLRLTLILDDNSLNLNEQHIDVAIRTESTDDAQISCIQLMPFSEYLVASPEYVNRHGAPLHPDNLSNHQWLAKASNHLPRNYLIKNSHNDEFKIRVTPFVSCNSTKALIKLLNQDMGLAILPNCLIQSQLDNQELIRLLPDYHLQDGIIYACHSYQDDVPPRVKILIDFLISHFQTKEEQKYAVRQ